MSTLEAENATAADEATSRIKIRVGGYTFETTKDTLMEIDYFRAFFCEAMGAEPDNEGVYFVDSSGDQFEHSKLAHFLQSFFWHTDDPVVLSYLRHRRFPFLWTKESGFDHERYSRLEMQADFFSIDRLKTWVSQQKFKEVVTHDKSLTMHKIGGPTHGDVLPLTPEDKIISTTQTMEKHYVCPRGIAFHNGNPSACGRQCRNAMGEDGPEYRDGPVFVIVMETEQVRFNLRKLLDCEE